MSAVEEQGSYSEVGPARARGGLLPFICWRSSQQTSSCPARCSTESKPEPSDRRHPTTSMEERDRGDVPCPRRREHGRPVEGGALPRSLLRAPTALPSELRASDPAGRPTSR